MQCTQDGKFILETSRDGGANGGNGGENSDDSNSSFLSAASFLSSADSSTSAGSESVFSEAESTLDDTASSVTSLLDTEREEDRPEVVARQARALENVTAHRFKRSGKGGNTKEALCHQNISNTFGLFALAVLIHGDQKGVTTSGMTVQSVAAFMAVTRGVHG